MLIHQMTYLRGQGVKSVLRIAHLVPHQGCDMSEAYGVVNSLGEGAQETSLMLSQC